MILPIVDSRVRKSKESWLADCNCGKTVSFSAKASALRMVHRGSCRYCKRDYRSVAGLGSAVYKRADGCWCSLCSGCGKEQAYTRKDHAKQSEVGDWQCKQCVANAHAFERNQPVGASQRLFNRYSKSAKKRGIDWDLTMEQMMSLYTGRCALTGWPLSIKGSAKTASLDRIDSRKGYTLGNVQWVHVMVNMCKNKYSQDRFVFMCRAIAETTPRPAL